MRPEGRVDQLVDPWAEPDRMPPEAAPSRAERRRASPRDQVVVWVIVVVAGVVGAFADAAPTGLQAADVAYRALAAALVALAASRARRWTWFVVGAVAGVTADGWWWLAGGAAIVVASVGSWRRRRSRPFGATVGALAVQGLLRQTDYGFHGASMLIGALTVLPLLVSAHRRCRRRQKRLNLIIAGTVAGLTVLALAGFGIAALQGRRNIADGATAARDALAAARRGDTGAAEALLAQSTELLEDGQGALDVWWARPARLVPVAAQNADALHDVLGDSLDVVAGGSGTVSRIGDYQSLAYTSGTLDLDRVAGLSAPIGDAAGIVTHTRARLDAIDRAWLIPPLTDQMDRLGDELVRAEHEATLAVDVLQDVPDLLGRNGTRRYFVAFVNPAEQRGAGGFVGQYGELVATDGSLELVHSGSTTELQAARPVGSRRITGLDEWLGAYGDFDPADYPQDLTFSPDFPTDAEALRQIYEQSGGQPVDGVIKLDPVALAALLRFTGPIDVPGLDVQLTSNNAADVLMRAQYLQEGERGDALVEATRVAFDELTSGSLPGPEQLIGALGPMVHERRLMLWSRHPQEQALFDRIGADGALPDATAGDVLSVSSQNLGNSKIDAYLHRTISYQAVIDPDDGAVRARLVVRLRNDAPASGLPRIVIGNNRDRPPGTNQMTLTVHSPLGARRITVDGEVVGAKVAEERGLRTYLLPVEVAARSSTTVTLELAGGLDLRDGYRLTAVPQPMVHPDTFTANLVTAEGWRAQHVIDDGPSGPFAERTSLAANPFDRVVSTELRLRR